MLENPARIDRNFTQELHGLTTWCATKLLDSGLVDRAKVPAFARTIAQEYLQDAERREAFLTTGMDQDFLRFLNTKLDGVRSAQAQVTKAVAGR